MKETAQEKERRDGLWSEYVHDRSDENRNRLVMEYLSWMRIVVSVAWKNKVKIIDSDEMYAIGSLALMKAIPRFDPDAGFRFQSFAHWRIKGEITDTLRTRSWAGRTAVLAKRDVDRGTKALGGILGRKPEDDELREWLELSCPEYNKLIKHAAIPEVFSVEVAINNHVDSKMMFFKDELADTSSTDPLEALIHNDLAEYITRGFDRRETLAIMLYYYKNLTMKTAGISLGLTESRVSQILESCRRRIKSRISKELLL